MAQEVEKRVLAKVIMLGNMGVGKTTLMNRYIDGNSAESKGPTVGSDFRRKDVKVGLMNVQL